MSSLERIDKKRSFRSLITLKEAHRHFVRPGLSDASSAEAERQGRDPFDITDKFLAHVALRIQVETGQDWYVFRDGVLYKKLEKGPHTLWNTNILLGRWQILRVNTRSVRLKFLVDGRIRGPALPQGMSGEANDELGLNVKAVFNVSCRLESVEIFLGYEEPIEVLFDAMNDLVYEMLPSCFYDQYGAWATKLARKLQGSLQQGPRRVDRLVGILIEGINVSIVESNTLHDSNVVKMFETVEQNKREEEEAKIQKSRDEIKVRSFVEQGKLLGLPPAVLALRDTELLQKMVELGWHPGLMNRPLVDHQSPYNSIINPMDTDHLQLSPEEPGKRRFEEVEDYNYSQFFATSFVPGESNNEGTQIEEPFQPPLRPERKEQEVDELKRSGFKCARKGHERSTVDAQGARSVEWILETYAPLDASFLGMAFHCPMGYPAVAPCVKVQQTPGGEWVPFASEIVTDWQPSYMLADIAEEVVKDRQR